MNKRLIKSSILAASIAVVLAGCTQKTPEELVTSASQLMEQGQADAAVLELKNAVEQKPSDGQIRFLLAKAYIMNGQFFSAEKELERALEYGIDELEMAPYLIQSKANLAKEEEIQELIKKYLKEENPSETVLDAFGYGGYYLVNKGSGFWGKRAFSILKDQSPEHRFSKLGEAWLQFEAEDYNQSAKLARETLALYPDFPEGIEVLGLALEQLDEHEQATAEFTRYLELRPYDADVRLHLANVLIYSEKLDEADEQLSILLGANEMDPISNMLLAGIRYEKQDFKSAKDLAEVALSSSPGLNRARLIAGMSSFQVQNEEQAYFHLTKVKDILPPTHQASRILQAVRLRLGYMEEIEEHLNANQEMDAELYAQTAREYMQRGQSDKAQELVSELEQVSELDQEMLSQRALLKISLDDDSGFEDLIKAVESDPNNERYHQLLVSEYVGARRYDDALAAISAWLQINPENDSAYTMQGLAHLQAGDKTQAEKAFRAALQYEENNPGALLNLALLNVEQRDYNKASPLFERILMNKPDYVFAIMHLQRMALEAGDINLAKVPFENVLASHPNNLPLLLADIRTMDNFGMRNEALAKLDALSLEHKSHPATLGLKGMIQINDDDPASAELSFAKLVDMNPTVAFPYRRLINVLEAQGKFAEALEVASLATERFPEDMMLLQFKAYFHSVLKEVDETAVALAKLDENGVKGGLVDRIRGRHAANTGDVEKSIESYYNIYEQKPTAVNALNLASKLRFLGNHQEAASLLENHRKLGFGNDTTNMYLAETYLEIAPEKAVAIYLEMDKKHPNNLAVLNNLAQAYIGAGNYPLAVDTALKASSVNSELAQVKDTLGYAYLKSGDVNAALPLLQQASENSESIEIALHYAEALKAGGKLAEASAIVAALVPKTQQEQDRIAEFNQ